MLIETEYWSQAITNLSQHLINKTGFPQQETDLLKIMQLHNLSAVLLQSIFNINVDIFQKIIIKITYHTFDWSILSELNWNQLKYNILMV